MHHGSGAEIKMEITNFYMEDKEKKSTTSQKSAIIQSIYELDKQ